MAVGVRGLDAVGAAEIEAYHDHGFLVVHNVLNRNETNSALNAIDDLIAGKNEQFNNVLMEGSAREEVDISNLQARRDGVRKIFDFVQFDQRLNALCEHVGLLKVVCNMIGGRKPKRYQDMALLKPPKIGREKPWHQDRAYFGVDLKDPIVGVWIALDEATLDNGCMHVIDGGHREGPRLHWKRRDWQICDSEMLGRRSVAVPLKPGGALFFDSLIPHGTPANLSPQRRRAIQFHYLPSDARRTTTEERLTIFGGEGKNATC